MLIGLSHGILAASGEVRRPLIYDLVRSRGFTVSEVIVRPGERIIAVGERSRTLEPLVMTVLITLCQQAGRLVTRQELMDACWGATVVGDDSLNRLIAALRRALHELAGDEVRIDTVPGTGYTLRLGARAIAQEDGSNDATVAGVLDRARNSWRLALPAPDYLVIEELRRATDLQPHDPTIWGWLALLLRHAAEYAPSSAASEAVLACEAAARKALALQPGQMEASVALISVVPLFGSWLNARNHLIELLDHEPDHAIAKQDLATLEMSTGRIRAGKKLRDELIAQDPLAAAFLYKSVYQHWSVRDLAGMDHVADKALHLWPFHPAVWTVRFWTLAYTGRFRAAAAMLADECNPPMPSSLLRYLQLTIEAAESGASAAQARLIEASRTVARAGLPSAMQAMFSLGLVRDIDGLFGVADGYFVGIGDGAVPLYHQPHEPKLNEQHRRVTQVLFTPVFADARSDPRFQALCERIGLDDYWARSGLTPDFKLGFDP